MEGTYVGNRLPAWTAIMAAALVLLAAPVGAASWLPPSADDLRMTAEPQAPKAVAIILYRQVDRDDTNYLQRSYRTKVFALPDVPVEFDEPVRDTDVFEFTLEW